MATNGSRDDLWLLTVAIDGTSIGFFDKKTGGDISAQSTKYRPAGLLPELSLGGPTTIANVTVSRLYDRVRDHALAKSLASRAGKARVSVAQQPLDQDGIPFGAPIRWTGTLEKVSFPQVDSTSSAASMLELDINPDGSIG